MFGGAVETGETSYANFLIPGVFASNAVLLATIASVSVVWCVGIVVVSVLLARVLFRRRFE